MNPIKSLWHILRVEVGKRKSKYINELKKCVEERWNKIHAKVLKKLV